MGVCCGKGNLGVVPEEGKAIEGSDKFPHILTMSIRNNYQFLRVIDHGQYGTVREAMRKDSSINSTTFAIKSILKSKVKNDSSILRKELGFMVMLDHPNIVKVYETYEDSMYFHMVLEHCKGGDLLDYLAKKHTLKETTAATLMKKVIISIQYLHQNNISHRDIKPENFLFTSRDPSAELKLTDFGVSARCRESRRMETFIGTPCYMAPEVLYGQYGKECDIWSIGVMLYYLLSGTLPFRGSDMKRTFEKIHSGKFNFSGEPWKKISREAKDLIKGMLVLNPKRRINLKDAIKHSWFCKFEKKEKDSIDPEVFDRLIKMKTLSKLKRQALKIVVKNMSNEQITDLKRAFLQIDTDRKGYISPDEILVAMQKSNFLVGHENFNDCIRKLADHDGRIMYSDFIAASMDTKRLLNEDVFWNSFKFFDTDGNGVIEKKEIKAALIRVGCVVNTEELEEIVEEADINLTNGINYNNFKKIIGFFEEEITEEPVSKRISVRYTKRRASAL